MNPEAVSGSRRDSDGHLFTVITVCRNSEAVIAKTIVSVLKQAYSDMEYLIIDGASTDSTVAVAEKYIETFQKRGCRYRIITEPDRGIYDAMNKGIQYAQGEVIGFLNAGDWYERDALKTVAKIYSTTGFDYFYADIRLVRADGAVMVKRVRMDMFPTSRHWNHPTNFTRKEIYKELGGFRCRGIHDDFEFFLRIRRTDKKIVIINKVLANFSAGGISNKKGAALCVKRIRDRFWGYAVNGYSPFYLLECIGIEIMKCIIC